MADQEIRDALANAMSRHTMTADWFEKADEIIADLARDGVRLIRLHHARQEPTGG